MEKTDKVKIVKVSSKTDPKQLSTSLKISLDSGYYVKAYAIGESIKVLAKALALLALISKNEGIKYDFQPMLEYHPDKDNVIRNILTWTVSRKGE